MQGVIGEALAGGSGTVPGISTGASGEPGDCSSVTAAGRLRLAGALLGGGSGALLAGLFIPVAGLSLDFGCVATSMPQSALQSCSHFSCVQLELASRQSSWAALRRSLS